MPPTTTILEAKSLRVSIGDARILSNTILASVRSSPHFLLNRHSQRLCLLWGGRGVIWGNGVEGWWGAIWDGGNGVTVLFNGGRGIVIMVDKGGLVVNLIMRFGEG